MPAQVSVVARRKEIVSRSPAWLAEAGAGEPGPGAGLPPSAGLLSTPGELPCLLGHRSRFSFERCSTHQQPGWLSRVPAVVIP